MKKITTISAALLMAASLCAQTTEKVGLTDPEFIEAFNIEAIATSGVNADGSVVYGQNPGMALAFYNFKNAEPLYAIVPADDDFFGITCGGITNDNLALVSHYGRSYLFNVDKNEIVTELQSPKETLGVDGWAISADGSVIGCNLSSSEDFSVVPMVGLRQADGTYKLEYLEYDKSDAMGCEAQYTQVRFISEDGKYLIGIQPDNRGMGGRLVVWTLQQDGSYKFSTPMDDYLYDLTCEKPGLAPEFDDYVTADPQTEPDLFDQQCNEFNQIFDEYEKKYAAFTRNGSALEIYLMHKATRSNVVCLALYNKRDLKEDDVIDDEMQLMIPVFYDFEKNEIKDFPTMGKSFAHGTLPDGGYIVAQENSGLYELTAVDAKGNAQPMHEWIKNLTGKDISDSYRFTFYDYMNDKDVEGIFLGLPFFSRDGKTLVLSGTNPDTGNITSILKFDQDIFNTSTGIAANLINEVTFGAGIIKIGESKHGVADVFTVAGMKCGTFPIEGSLDLNNTLEKGVYIVRVSVENEKPLTFKLCIQ